MPSTAFFAMSRVSVSNCGLPAIHSDSVKRLPSATLRDRALRVAGRSDAPIVQTALQPRPRVSTPPAVLAELTSASLFADHTNLPSGSSARSSTPLAHAASDAGTGAGRRLSITLQQGFRSRRAPPSLPPSRPAIRHLHTSCMPREDRGVRTVENRHGVDDHPALKANSTPARRNSSTIQGRVKTLTPNPARSHPSSATLLRILALRHRRYPSASVAPFGERCRLESTPGAVSEFGRPTRCRSPERHGLPCHRLLRASPRWQVSRRGQRR